MNKCRVLKKRLGNQGFTLVETMVVLLILGILMSVTAGGLVAYLRHANFKKNNEYAQTIYTAAQSSFTYAKTSGQLEELADELNTDVEPTRYNTKNKLTKDMITNGANLDDRDRMYTMTFKKGFKSSSDYFGAYKTVYDMVAVYVYDQEILDNTFTVEFDPVDGKILGVCYDDKADDFNYESTNSNRNYSIKNRDRSARYEYLIGYYGIDTLSARAPETGGRPVINNQALVNSDTLYLRWRLSSQYANVTESLTYQIKLYKKSPVEGQKDILFASFAVNGDNNKIKAESNTDNPDELFVKADVTLYDDNGNVTDTKKNMQFKAYESSNRMLYVVLDGADQASDSQVGLQTGDYDNTYSIKRLGIKDASNIYATVQGTGTSFKATARKQTKTENSYFASGSIDTSGNLTYKIANARHLFNMRFSENEIPETNNVNYVQSSDFAWDGEDSLVSSGNLFYGQKTATDSGESGKQVFPMIPELKKNHSYKSETDKQYKISGLNLRSKDNTALNATGLFGKNSGTIASVTIASADVQGTNYVGALCGINGGSLSHVTVDYNSTIEGTGEYVGGIVGSDQSGYVLSDGSVQVGTSRTYEYLKNEGDVKGGSYVGGIIGYIHGYYQPDENTKAGIEILSIKNCDNTGFVRSTKEDGQCIGGIVGYNKQTHILECSSAPELPSTVVEREYAQYLKGVCKGDYVGGIVGFNENADISKCHTESDNTDTYVAGRDFVGGIVGFQTGELNENGTMDTGLTLSGDTDGSNGVNQANVVGRSYVGGIAGFNGKVTGSVTTNLDGTKTIQIHKDTIGKNKNAKITNWNNRGVIMATNRGDDNEIAEYAGGITGYNGGIIENCTTNVDTNAVSGKTRRTFASEVGGTGNYVGGMAGYNAGSITASGNMNVNSVAAGQRYVGGVVGYEAEGSSISEHMQLKGGYVYGKYFAGGLIGLNRSQEVYDKQYVTKPTDIQGELFVGGIFGGNILSKGGDLKLETSNSLGKVKGRAFVGGYIGYNKAVEAGYKESEDLNTLCTDLSKTNKEIETVVQKADSSDQQMNLGSKSGDTLSCYLDRVEGDIYVGGVAGYNGENTKLYIYNIENKTKVTAKAHISGDYDKEYSYGGGIIGLVSKNMYIYHCKNESSGKVTTKGTYHGGLAEENLGIISTCDANTFGSSTTDYVGGIAGVNAKSGRIQECKTIGTITGNNRVGGIVSENYGRVEESKIENNVNGSGDGIGGVAGANEKGGIIENSKINNSIIAKGNNVGGVVGINEKGTLNNTNVVKEGITIQGHNGVGGYIGENIEADLTGLRNNATVDADANAGGIAGKLSGSCTITNCENTSSGKVTANKTITMEGKKKGYAGGITSSTEKGVEIKNCTNKGTVLSAAGEAGGMTGNNGHGAVIISPTVDDGKITGKAAVGGVAATNEGKITNAVIEEGVTLSKVSTANDVSMGGVVGENGALGTITNASVGTSSLEFKLKATSDGGNYGSVAGKNEGMLSGGTSEGNSKIIYGVVSSGSSVNKTSANMGGIVGDNNGTIKYYKFSGSVMGKGNSNYGYGGIAGINRNTITYCGLVGNTSLVEAVGDAMDIASIGGIAGRNEKGAILSHSYVNGGNSSGNAIVIQSTSVGYVGGYCGYNLGTVTKNNTSSVDGYVTIQTSKGHLGGMIGNNDKTGVVTQSTTGGGSEETESNHHWKVIAKAHATDNGTGGAIGYNASGKDIKEIVNYADVTKSTASGTNACGGIVGRLENQSNSAWRMSNCKNYGTITGRESTGGMIGRWKYKGGTIEKCENYGSVTGSGMDIGGIIGDLYQVTDKESFTVTGCKNYANLINPGVKNVGGIIGGSGSATISNVNLNIYNCINTGKITGSSSVAGIVGYFSIYKLNVKITKCRNYGLYEATSNGGGIYGSGSGTTIENCFGVSTVEHPITSSKVTMKNSYCFDQAKEGEEDSISNIAWPSGSNNGNVTSEGESILGSLVDDNWSTRYTRLNVEKDGTKGKGDIVITFNNNMKLNSFTTYWFSNDASKRRIYTYNIYYWNNVTKSWVKANPDSSQPITATGSKKTDTEATKKSYGSTVEFGGVETGKIKIEVLGNSTGNNAMSLWEMKVNEKSPVLGINTTAANTAIPLHVSKNSDKSTYRAINIAYDADITDLPKSPLDITDTMSDDNRKSYYELIDPKLILFYNNQYGIGKLETPTGLALTSKDGNYIASWDSNEKVFYYKLVVEVYETQGDTVPVDSKEIDVTSGSSASIPMEDDWGGKYITFSVQAMNGDDTDNGQPDSNDSEVARLLTGQQIKPFLPTPDVHYELYKKADGNPGYRIVLKNSSEYSGSKEDAVIHVYQDDKEVASFSAKEGSTDNIVFEGNNYNVQYTAYAEAGGTLTDIYNDSSRYGRESVVLTFDKFTQKIINASFNGFTGLTPDTLSYVALLSSASNEIYYRTEFMVTDEKLNIPVVVSSSKVRVSKSSSTSPVTLDKLPKDIADKDFSVRSYPISSQNDVAEYTLLVKEGLDIEDPKDKAILESYIDGSTAKAGYSIEKVNGKYDVYYSLLLDQYDTYSGCIYWKQKDELKAPKSSQTAPVLPDTISQSEDFYTFEWDKDQLGGKYEVVITGTTLKGEEVELWSSAETSEHEYRVDGSEWMYKNIHLKVTRLGEQNTSGILTKYGTTTTKDYPQKIHLPKMESPTIELVDSNELNYKVGWNIISNTYKDYFDYYAIVVTDTNHPEKSFTVKENDITKSESMIDLDSVAGDKVTITVRAVAKENSDVYQSGKLSDEHSLQVPLRIDTPIVDEFLTLTPQYDAIVSQDDFENKGVSLHMTAQKAGEGGYVLKAGIFEDANADLEKDKPDAQINKGEQLSMSGNLKDSKTSFKDISYDFAGYYLKVKLRSVNEGEISSLWSAVETFRLPKVRINTPKISQETKDIETEITTTFSESSGSEKKTISFDSILFQVPSNDEGKLKDYIIETKAAQKDQDDKDTYKTIASVDNKVTPEKNVSPFTIMENNKEIKQENTLYETTTSKDQTTVTHSYMYKLGYVRDLEWTNEAKTVSYQGTFHAYLQAVATVVTQNGKSATTYSYELILPDITDSDSLKFIDGVAHRYTDSVQVKGEAADTSRYGDTYTRQWRRTVEEDKDAGIIYGTEISEIKE
ncbi:MAG: type II secretion system protein [Anaerostipes sp.]|nr:type II secretion system protein [Anaerostipes sp.]